LKTTLNKAIITGNLHELFKYEKPIKYGFKFTPEQLQAKKRRAFNNFFDLTDEEKKERQALYLQCSSERAKLKIRRLVQGNMYRFKVSAKFLTLTFNTQMEDLSTANKIFTNFIKRFDRKAGYKIRYVAVPEFQKNGRVHYHMILFNAPFISEKSIALDIWKNGSVEIQTVYKTKGLCTYMSKYISKSFLDPRYKAHKRYFFSLEEHTIIEKQEEVVNKIIDSIDSKFLTHSYTYKLYDWKIHNKEEREKNPINNVTCYEYMVFDDSGGVGVVSPP
jgi:hypothetical protein